MLLAMLAAIDWPLTLQVAATVIAALAAVAAWLSARSSAKAGERLVLAAEHERLERIRKLVAGRPAGELERGETLWEVGRLLRSSDELPLTRALIRPDHEAGTAQDFYRARDEVEAALASIERRLGRRRR
jgi:hypothetical protein